MFDIKLKESITESEHLAASHRNYKQKLYDAEKERAPNPYQTVININYPHTNERISLSNLSNPLVWERIVN